MKTFTILLTILSLTLSACSNTAVEDSSNSSSSSPLTPVESISHAHGLAVDVADPSKLYIATHFGLFVLVNDTDLYQIGEATDDYMGFYPHPTEANVFYSSGHPSFGGNLGVQKSEDGGVTWTKISEGVGGPVDFHTMAISPADPNVFYGWYGGELQRSTDAGLSWEVLETDLSKVIGLRAAEDSASTLFAATQSGLLVSTDQGLNWSSASSDLDGAIVTALVLHPTDAQTLFTFSDRLGLAKSSDGGKTWASLPQDFGTEVIVQIAISQTDPELMYLITSNNALYKSTDGGTTWTLIQL